MEVRPKSKDPNGEVVEGNEEDYQMESVIEEGDEVDKDEERDRKGQSTEQDRVGEEDSKGKKCDTSATKKDLESSKFTSVFPEQVSSGDVPSKAIAEGKKRIRNMSEEREVLKPAEASKLQNHSYRATELARRPKANKCRSQQPATCKELAAYG
eukprot:CAMPEP_0113918720 /NCGR_PEP_ID=MMETSP0780_2-20120614/33520_1 /TAXON_ID=652834 /ORGANISM="Palpitomonas bilix" /LENGTH=153 /DNA_ID=CAMNT_0000918583 /DNA_START=1651 /DNA_END=2113 /DNA_ORIENTATION=+ /assembly_acc=CAM_ASM_000599